MVRTIISHKSTRLFLILAGFFIANALIAEIIGVKIFSLEKTLGLAPLGINIFGQQLDVNLTAGVLLWPVVFIMTDIINEYYGFRGVKFLSILTAAIIGFAFIVFYAAIHLAPDNYWIGSQKQNGVPDMQAGYAQILGQGMSIIFASLTAFLVGQMADATVFKKIKIITGEKGIWMRATLSTLVSQLIDTFVVGYIYLYFSIGFSFPRVTAIGLTGYSYKFIVAIICTPLVYLAHNLIESYLGKSKAAEMKRAALEKS